MRAAGIAIFIVPHHRAEPHDVCGWRHPSPDQPGAKKIQRFAKGSQGGDWYREFAPQPGDVVVKEHWGGNGFANPALDKVPPGFATKGADIADLRQARALCEEA